MRVLSLRDTFFLGLFCGVCKIVNYLLSAYYVFLFVGLFALCLPFGAFYVLVSCLFTIFYAVFFVCHSFCCFLAFGCICLDEHIVGKEFGLLY